MSVGARKSILRLGIAATLVLLGMVYGVLSYKFQWPPYEIVHTLGEWLFSDEDQAEALADDFDRLLPIKSPADIVATRNELITLLWGVAALPKTRPSSIVSGFDDPRYKGFGALERIDKLVVTMDFGLESHVYHFIPKVPTRHVVLYHEGHDGDFYNSREQIKRLLEDGYAVVAFCMPLMGLNNQPTIEGKRSGKLKLTSHNQMAYLTPKSGHPIQYFIEPVVAVLNYLEARSQYDAVSMVGLSGGGWTTTMAAAVDTRIGKSFPVAGSYPLHLRSNAERDWGDYEQVDPKIYSEVGYLELYVLGASGVGRKQLQVLNKYDSCCFRGTKWMSYRDAVAQRVRDLGPGEFDIFGDASHADHVLSPLAMTRIREELARGGSPVSAARLTE